MSETLLRQWALLREIPSAPRKISAGQLQQRLEAAGYPITKRSVERDLQMLSATFPLVHDDRSIPYGWSWSAHAPAFDLPAMDGETALTLALVERELTPRLPSAVLTRLGPYFKRAETVLQNSASPGLRRWSDVVRVVPHGQPLLAPKLDPETVTTLYESLFEGRQLKMHYHSRASESGEPSEAIVHPLAIVGYGPVLYLIATFWQFTDPRHLALHRISRAEKLSDTINPLDGFDIDRYLESGAFQLPNGSPIQLEVLFEAFTARHLTETPLSTDQAMATEADGRIRVTATVQPSEQLIWWLLGFGRNAEVIAPTELRKEIRMAVEESAKRYRQDEDRP